MVKISYSKKISVEDLNRLLRELISVTENKNKSITVEDIPVPLSFNKILELELDLEIGDDENELELSLTWSKSKGDETGREMTKAIEELGEAPNVEVGTAPLKIVENLNKIPEPVVEEKSIPAEQAELREEESLNVEKKLEEVISMLSSQDTEEIKEEEESDFKPQGNLLKIAEEQPDLGVEEDSKSGLQVEIPEYKSVADSSSTALEEPELEVEKSEVETSEEENSTEELEKILKALKESQLTEEEKKD